MARLVVSLLSVATALKTPLSSAAALKTSRALAVRGGAIDVQQAGAALIGLEGLVGIVAPLRTTA